MADPKQLLISLPGAGKTQAYQLSADTPVHFGFDLAEAVFTGNDGNLEIAIEGGGTVILEGYQALADAGDLPLFEMVDGDVVAGDVYLFAFTDQQATAEDMETAAGANTGSSGAGQYNDDPGTLFAGLDAMGGQGDAFGGEGLGAAAAELENQAPVANPDTNEVTEQGDVDLYVNPEDPASHIVEVHKSTVTFQAGETPGDGGETPVPRLFAALSAPGPNVSSIDPDTGAIHVDDPGMTITAHSNTPGDEALVVTGDGLGVDNNGSTPGDNPAIDDKYGQDWVQIEFDDPQGYVQIVLGEFNEGSEFGDDATITLYGADGLIGTFHMDDFDGDTFEYTVRASDDLITEVRVAAGGGAFDFIHNDFYIESISATAVPEGDFFPTDESGNGYIINYPEGEHSFQDVTGNVIDNDFDAETPDNLLMHSIDFVGENHEGNDEAAVLMTGNGTEVMGKYGILTIDLNGDYTYSLNPDWADPLEEGQVVEEVFNYTIVDPSDAVSNMTTLTITVYGTNDAPVAVHDFDNQAIEQGDSTGYDLPADYPTNDDNPDDLPDLTPSIARVSEGPAQGGDELHDYTHMVAARGNVLLNDSDVDDLDYTDPDNPDTPEVEGDFTTLFVIGVYSNESMEYDWVAPGEGGTPYPDAPTADGQVLDVATIADADMTIAGKYGHLTIGTDGTYTYTPDIEENVAPLNYDTPGFESFSYAIMDDSGAFSYQSITFKVNGANDAPDVDPDHNAIIEFGANGCPGLHYTPWVFGNVLLNDSDVDDTYIYVDKITAGGVTHDIAEGGYTIIEGEYGVLKIWSNGSYKYTLDQENRDVQALNVNEDGSFQTLPEQFTYSATNSWDDGVASETTLTITILGSNDAPEAVPDVPLVAYVSDFSDAAGELSFTASGMTFIPLVANMFETAHLTSVPGMGLGVRDWGDTSPAIDNSGDVNGVMIRFDNQADATTINLSSIDIRDDIRVTVQFANGSSETFTLHEGDIDFDAAGNASLHLDYDLDMTSVTLWTTWEAAQSDSFYIQSVITTPAHLDMSGVHAVEAGEHHDHLIDMDGPDVAATIVGGNVLLNDTDVDDVDFGDGTGQTDLTVVGAGFGNDAGDIQDFSGSLTLQGTYGTLTIGEDGYFTYNPNTAKADGLNNGDVVTDTFVYAISDNHDGGWNFYGREAGDWSTLTVTVEGTNDAPVARCDSVHYEIIDVTTGTADVANGFDVDGIAFTALSSYMGQPIEAELTYTGQGLGVRNSAEYWDSNSIDNFIAHDAIKIDFGLAQSSVTIELSGYNNWYEGHDDDVEFVVYDMAGNLITTISKGGSFDGDITIDLADTGNVPIGSIVVQTESGFHWNDDFYIASVQAQVMTLGGEADPTELGDLGHGEYDGGIDVAGNVLLNDTDVDNLDYGDGDHSASELSVVGIHDLWGNEGAGNGGVFTLEGQFGTLTIQANGVYTYVLDQDKVDGLEEGMHRSETFIYTVSDNQAGGELHDTSALTFDIIGTNDAPVAVNDMNHGVMLTENMAYTPGDAYATIDFSDWTPAHVDKWVGYLWDLHKIDVGDGDNTWWQDASLQGVNVWARNNSGLDEHLVQDNQDGNLGVDTTTWPIDVVFDTNEVNNGYTYAEEIVIDFTDGRGEVTVALGSLVTGESATVVAYDSQGNEITRGTATDGLPTVTLTASGAAIAQVVLSPDGDSSFTLASLGSKAPGTSTRDVVSDGKVAGNVMTNDYDVDMNSYGSTETMAVVAASMTGLYGDLVLQANGHYTYIPDEIKIDALSDTYVETFEYQIVDAHGATDTATLYIPLHYESLNEITGTMGADNLTGTAGDDIITGRAGGDHVDAGLGDDVVIGNRGADTIDGGQGDDILFGDKGNDHIMVSAGHDIVTLGEGADTIHIDPANIIINDGLDNDAASVTVVDFNVAEGDALQIADTLVGTHVDITSDNSDITLMFTDLNHDGNATTNDTLQVILSGVDPANHGFSDHVVIDSSDQINDLIQQIIDSPDNN